MTFGKYKNQPESAFIADEDYCVWWSSSATRMAWLEDEHPTLHALISEKYRTRSTNTNSKEEQEQDMELFEYAVTYVPRNDAGDVIQDEVKILVNPTAVLTKSEAAVRKEAIAGLSDKTLNLEYVLVAVRSFGTGAH